MFPEHLFDSGEEQEKGDKATKITGFESLFPTNSTAALPSRDIRNRGQSFLTGTGSSANS